VKHTHPAFRITFCLGSLLSLLAGIQLFLLSDKTDLYFSWTIQSTLTAATFGAFYFGTLTFGFFAARRSVWAIVRGPAYGNPQVLNFVP
jgi:hypothetical protein